MKRTRFIAILLTMVMLASLMAACGGTATPAPASTPAESTAAASTEATVAASTEATPEATPEVKVEPLMKFDPPIEISVIKTADTFFGYSEDQTPSKNDIYKLWEDVVGIKFVNKIETATAAYDQKVKLAIASDDLPDMIATGPAEIQEMARNGMLADLKPFMDSYMTDRAKSLFGAFDGKLYAPVSREGGTFALPSTSSIEGNLRSTWIRKDWLDALGKTAPTTMEETLDLALAFATMDPDKNGKKDTWGLPIDKEPNSSLLNTFEIVANAYGAYPNRIIKNEAGEVVLGLDDPKVKVVLKKMQDLYKAGAIDKEFAAKDFMQVDADVGAGKYGLWLGVFWKPVDPGFAATYSDGVEWVVTGIPASSTVKAYNPYVPFPVSTYYAMSNKCEHPEALLVMANHFMNQDLSDPNAWPRQWGDTGAKHPGIPTNNWSPVQWQDPLFFDAVPLEKALADPDWDRLNPKFAVHGQAYDIIKGITKSEDPEKDKVMVNQFTDIFLKSCKVMGEYDQNGYVFDAYYGAPTETQSKQGSILAKMATEAIVQIISGSKPIDYYDEFVAEYKKQGGAAILEEVKAKLAQ